MRFCRFETRRKSKLKCGAVEKLQWLEACLTNKSDLRSLDFVLDRFFMKLFRTSNVAIVRQCQELLGFQLPSITLCKRVDKFVGKYYASDNLLCKMCSKFV